MSKLLIVANRLPVTVERRQGENRYRPSVGGLATGLASLGRGRDMRWIGWAETGASRLDASQREVLRHELGTKFDSLPVFLTADDISGFYHGFSNRTLWPLFHYFPRYAEFNPEFWRAYERVNRKYRDAVLEAYEPGDTIWVHDYLLMLVPGLLRQQLPDAPIGFFMHIPFPSYELFRLLPWRRELLRGVLGANLIGFHTHDYVRHFLGSVHSLLGLEDRNGLLRIDEHLALVDAFPMGIDVKRYAEAGETRPVRRERERLSKGKARIVLSVDRLDYTKGIPERLRAFDLFLSEHPEWRGKVTLFCVAVPSRSRVWRYRELKREVDGLVGNINGRWGTVDWVPVRYLYRSLPFNLLLGLYTASDVALVTPLRDGMNLIAKEYVASRADCSGVLVLSEMAGAALELSEALVINPQDEEAVAEAINEALTMDPEEQVRRIASMQRRLRRYDVNRWAQDFLGKLDEVMMRQLGMDEYLLTKDARNRLLRAFEVSNKRLLVLDYDGTLVPFSKTPNAAVPDESLLKLLASLAADPTTDVVIVSGRTRESLEGWFGRLDASLVAEHGAWIRERGGEWVTSAPLTDEWKDEVRGVLETYVDRTPGSFVEEKDFSLAWHYRAAARDLSARRVQELTETLAPLGQAFGLSLLQGSRVLEVKPAGVDKGNAAHRWTGRAEYDFVLVIGDDVTDEDMFEAAPPGAWTIRIGGGPSAATFAIDSSADVRALLRNLVRRARAAVANRA